MPARCSAAAVLFLGLVALAAAQTAPDTALPPPEAVLDRYVEATGGLEAHGMIRSRTTESRVVIEGQNIEGILRSWEKAPDRHATELELRSQAMPLSVRSGYDGAIAWSSDPMLGNRALKGEELSRARLEASFHAHTRWREIYPTVKTLRSEVIDGRNCWIIEQTPAEGRPVEAAYDAETGLQVRAKTVMPSPLGDDVTATNFFSDWQIHDGIRLPGKMVMDMGVSRMVVTLKSVKHNVDVDDAVFRRPAKKAAGTAPASPAESRRDG